MGFNFAAIDGVLKIYRGNRIILKGNRLNNLYYLQCSTVDAEAVSIAFQKRMNLLSGISTIDERLRCGSKT